MLVLARQRDQTIVIGEDIEVTVVDIRGDKVRLGINAPTVIPVHRKEVYEQIKADKAPQEEKFRMAFSGKVEFNKEDSGMALIAQLDKQEGESEVHEDGMFVRIQSWDEKREHFDAKKIAGKKVRVIIEEI